MALDGVQTVQGPQAPVGFFGAAGMMRQPTRKSLTVLAGQLGELIGLSEADASELMGDVDEVLSDPTVGGAIAALLAQVPGGVALPVVGKWLVKYLRRRKPTPETKAAPAISAEPEKAG